MSFSKILMVMCSLFISASVSAESLRMNEASDLKGQAVSNSLRGRHAIELGIGLLSEVSASHQVSAGSVTTKSESNGLIGSCAYTYWLENNVGISFRVGVLDVDATTAVDGSETFVEASTVVPMLFGVKYQPFGCAIGEVMRPYVSAFIGPYIGTAAGVRTGVTATTESYTETALGSYLGAGADLSLSKLFTIGIGVGYHLVDDFNRRIGSEKNYSSPDFSLSLGIVFGRGKREKGAS